jgi:hypothetical protein
MKQIKNFEEFDYNEYHITTDLGSAFFHFDQDLISLQGSAYGAEDTLQIEVLLDPEDTPEFNNSVSASDGELLGDDLSFEAELIDVQDLNGESI